VLVLSGSPASVVADLRVDLPGVRDQITTRESDAFVTLRGEVARLLNVGRPTAQRKVAAEAAVAAKWAEAERAALREAHAEDHATN